MALVEMVMPKMGESIMEGTILNWLKKVGDRVEQDESVLEVATDKVDTEVPSTHAGILMEILAKAGEVVQVGKPIARIETAAAAVASVPDMPATTTQKAVVAPAAATDVSTSKSSLQSNKFYSPLVLSIAKEEQISISELDGIKGSGSEGRVTKNDILAYLQQRKSGTAAAAVAPKITQPVAQNPAPQKEKVADNQTKAAVSLNGAAEIIEMDRMRKIIAQRMVESKQISPHVTSFVEADVTNLVRWRNNAKREFMDKEGAALTFTPVFIYAVAKALKDYPMVNVSVDGERIIRHKHINIGMAVALPNGNLIVPVIHHADQLNLTGLALKVNDLARRARDNKIKPDELVGGTYTISNIGSFGNVMGTPIIVQPQVAIMAFGTIQKKPAVIETPEGDMIGIRQLMFLSHSYDHRVVDGALGGMFVRKVADYLERFEANTKLT